ncbi:hypothetical protein HQ560_17665, partial [bacterium]|nr:hypothetical protein [bacterium]
LLATGGGGDEREPVLPKHMADALAADKAKLEGKRAPTAPKAPAKTARKTPRKTVPKARKPPPPIRGHCRTATTDLGGLARYEREKDCTGFWVDDSMVYWTVDVERTGLYEVEIHYAGDKEVEGNVIEISLADEKIHVPIKVTGSWETFVKVTAPDRLKATKGQKRTLSVRPFKKQKGKGLVNLRSVILTWVGEAP